MFFKIVVAIAAAVIPWLILLIVFLGFTFRIWLRRNKKWEAIKIVYHGVPINEAGFWGITVVNIVVVNRIASWLFVDMQDYYPYFIYGYMVFAVPIFILAVVGSFVENDKERSIRYAKGEEKI